MLWRISSTSETRGERFHETGYAGNTGFPLLLILYFALVIRNRYLKKIPLTRARAGYTYSV